MNDQFSPVTDVQALEPLFERSRDEPVLLFKHDTACPISAAAHRELSRLGGGIPLIDVERAKDVSREIESRTSVRHESPQVIMLRNGEAVWSASHFDITADAVDEAARRHA